MGNVVEKVEVGHYGTAVAEDHGIAIAGDHGVAVAGHYGTAKAGDHGYAWVGHYGTATAGEKGSAGTGLEGTAIVGKRGRAAAGMGGKLIFHSESGKKMEFLVDYASVRPILWHEIVDGKLVLVDDRTPFTSLSRRKKF